MIYKIKQEDLNALDHITELDLEGIVDDSVNLDELEDNLREAISEVEVIYYDNAMEFLSDEDQSLQESTAIAVEYGYKLEDIDSETLATLLKQERMNEELPRLLELLED